MKGSGRRARVQRVRAAYVVAALISCSLSSRSTGMATASSTCAHAWHMLELDQGSKRQMWRGKAPPPYLACLLRGLVERV